MQLTAEIIAVLSLLAMVVMGIINYVVVSKVNAEKIGVIAQKVDDTQHDVRTLQHAADDRRERIAVLETEVTHLKEQRGHG